MPRPNLVPLLLLLAALPVLAHAPALAEGRLLGPGKGAALDYPFRAEAWAAYRRGELPGWNPAIFSGAPLLAAYRPGALYPPLLIAGILPPFAAFQVLVLGSLSAAAVLFFLYLRRLGANRLGAYVAGLAFALGPYLVDDLGDTATVLAAPLLPLLLLAAEAHLERATALRAAGLSTALALLLLAGSSDAVAAGGALLLARLLLGHLSPGGSGGPSPLSTALALLAGLLLAAPQLLPTLLAARAAGPPPTGTEVPAGPMLPGVTSLVLRYVSHTPAPSLALVSLPLAFTLPPIRVLALALGLALALQWGRAPLTAPGPLALVFDVALAVVSGLALSALWEARRGALGRRLRAYLLVASLASATALSVAAAVLGPLPQTLAGAVGVLALAFILFFTLAEDPDPLKAGLFVLPLTVSFLLQPHGRGAWAGAPTLAELERATPTRQAIDRAMGEGRTERILSLVRQWPTEAAAADLAYGNLGGLIGRRNANGYDPLVPLRQRQAFDGMSAGGTLPDAFLRSDPGRLRVLGVAWVQAPADVLACHPDASGLGESLDLPFEAGRPRFFPLPISAATEVRLAIGGAESLGEGTTLAAMRVRLASGRDISLIARASRELAGPYAAVSLGGRYFVDGVWLERRVGPGRLTIRRLGLWDATSGRATAVSLVSGFVSDAVYFREAAATPLVRLFEIPGGLGRARVVESLRRLPDDQAVLRTLRLPTLTGFDARREALVAADEAAGVALSEPGRSSRAEVVRGGGRMELRAVGPGVLVVTEAWDPGWTARIDGAAARLLRLNAIHMGVVLGPGAHRVLLRYGTPGLGAGLALAGLGLVGLALLRPRRRS